jgi:hypothetical protein
MMEDIMYGLFQEEEEEEEDEEDDDDDIKPCVP